MKHLKFYSRELPIFRSVQIRLLRELSDISLEYRGESIDDMGSNLLQGEVVQMSATPDSIHIGLFNERGNGTSFYIVNKDGSDFIEGKDFEFVFIMKK